MNPKIKQTWMGVLTIVFCGYVQAQDSPSTVLEIFFKSGQTIEGELLRVRDTALVISTDKRVSPYDSVTQSSNITVVPNSRIQRVVIKGESGILKGMGYGLVIGAATGALAGALSPEHPGIGDWELVPGHGNKIGVGAMFGGAAGLLVGSIVGLASTTHDKVVEPDIHHGYGTLRNIARYPIFEPSDLRKIR
jgi:hypothetical protein